MPCSFSLRGIAALTNLPDQHSDFHDLLAVADDTCGSEDIVISVGHLILKVDTSEASYGTGERMFEALNIFLTKHGAGPSTFVLVEDDDVWHFGPTPRARWQAQFDYLQRKAQEADEALGDWCEANPMPEA